MKKTLKHRAAPLFLLVVIAATFAACRKTPVKNSPGPIIIPTPISLGKWQKVATIPDAQTRVLEVADNKLYAAGISGIVYSTADGQNWTASGTIANAGAITALTVFKNKLYAGTEINGIFASDNGGQTWTNSNPTLLEASSFALLNDTLYSASAAVSGIEVYDETRNRWSAFKNGLPTNYNLDVQKLLQINNTLFSVQGENGNFYVYNKRSKQWTEEYFFGASYTPGLRVNDMLEDAGVLYAAYDDAVLNSQNAGVYWSYDTVGLKRGPNTFAKRVIYAGTDNYYTVHNTGNDETWVQQRNRAAQPGSTWATGQEHLPIGPTYQIREFNGMIFLATDHGIYFKPLH